MARNENNAEKRRKKADLDLAKTDIIGFRGGQSINLDKKSRDGVTLREKLSDFLYSLLKKELENQESRLKSIKKWQNLYKGKKKPKSFPYPNCANLAIPITRSNTDAIFVRIIEAIFGKRKVWIVRAKKPQYIELAREIEEALDHFQRRVLKLKQKLLSPLLQAVKIGTGIVKVIPEKKVKTIYRYATQEEIENPQIKKYSLPNTTRKLVKIVQTIYEGPNVYPVPREDFIISSDANDVQEALLVGFRTRMRYAEIELRARQGIYDEKAIENLVHPDEFDDVKKGRADSQGKELEKIDPVKEFDIWELYLRYDVDNDGEEDDIVVTFHLESKTILRAIYNPMFSGFRPLVAFKGSPIEFSFDGEGVCEILEKVQEEIDAIHNARLDRLAQINAPIVFYRAGLGLDNFTLEPGKVWSVDDLPENAIKIFNWPEIYPSTEREEDRLVMYADRAVGITPAVMGVSTAERPVAAETIILREEANKKFKNIADNIRDGIIELGYSLLEYFAQYSPTYSYSIYEEGKLITKTVNFPIEFIRDIFEISLEASSELISQEIRRQINLTVYQLLSDYMTKIAGMVQAVVSPQVPSDFKRFLLKSAEVSATVVERILEDFDLRDAENLVVDATKTIDTEKAIAMSPDLQPPPPPPGAVPMTSEEMPMTPEGMPPQGQPMPPQPPMPEEMETAVG